MGIINDIIRKITRPLRLINIDRKAEKVISQDKPVPAPRYKADEEALEKILKENPSLPEEMAKKNTELDNRLRTVFVTSTDIQPEEPIVMSDNRSLPLSRKVVDDFEYGCKEPDVVPEGRALLRDAIKFINDHCSDNQVHTSSEIATQYKMKKEDVDNILDYYSSFELYIPKKLTQPVQAPKWYQKLLKANEAFLENSDKK